MPSLKDCITKGPVLCGEWSSEEPVSATTESATGKDSDGWVIEVHLDMAASVQEQLAGQADKYPIANRLALPR